MYLCSLLNFQVETLMVEIRVRTIVMARATTVAQVMVETPVAVVEDMIATIAGAVVDTT